MLRKYYPRRSHACVLFITVYTYTALISLLNYVLHSEKCGPGYRSRYSYSLRAGRSEDRIPPEAIFFARVQTDPGAHPASYTMVTGSIPEGKAIGVGR
jgi:hypothetical protein